MDSSATISVVWHPAIKFLFRFCFVYFFLYCFPFPLDGFDFTTPVAKPYYHFFDWLVPLIGRKWFHLKAVITFPLFDKVDDSRYGLVFIYCTLIISASATIIWSYLDWKRKNYLNLNEWLKIYLRYFLAAYLFGYGFVKVFPSQFQEITASRLVMTVGDQSPMLLAWNFMGYSTTLMKLNGLVEVIAGLLLLFRRTTTIGAIAASFAFAFIVLMDFCFNIPVRLLASHLLIISVFLILEDSPRLLNVFILNKTVPKTIYPLMIAQPRGRRIFTWLQLIFSVCLFYSSLAKGLDAQQSFGRQVPHVPLYGVYKTVYFIRNNDSVAPTETDTLRWKQLVIDGGSWNQSGVIQFGNDSKTMYDIEVDTLQQKLHLKISSDTLKQFFFHYAIKNNNQILFKGLWQKDSIEVLMHKYDLNNFLLHKEKFRWITY